MNKNMMFTVMGVKSETHIRAVAEVSGLNFLESRKALKGGVF